MKKRLLTALLAGVMAATCAMGAVACGDNGDGKTDDHNKTFRSEKIETEAAWKAAFDYSDIHNVTVDSMLKVGANRERIYLISVDGNKMRKVGKNDGEEYDLFKEFDDTSKIEYSYSYDAQLKKYIVDEYDRSEFETWTYDVNHDVDELDDMSEITERYADYHYDEKLGAYVAEYSGHDLDEDWDLVNYKVVVKFKDGKFLEGSIDGMEKTKGKIDMKVSVINVGTTTITLPTNVQNSQK